MVVKMGKYKKRMNAVKLSIKTIGYCTCADVSFNNQPVQSVTYTYDTKVWPVSRLIENSYPSPSPPQKSQYTFFVNSWSMFQI